MDEYWGVQVSYCTGVARRVLLRTLVSDLLRAFPGGSNPDVQRFEMKMRDGSCKLHDFQSWLETLPQNSRQQIFSIVRTILDTLRSTGLDSTEKYFCVAWPFEGDITRCLKVPLEGPSSWVRFLADSHDTATFAYITMDCLQTESVRCQGAQGPHQDDIHLLETTVTRTINDDSGQWTLNHEEIYYFSKLDSIFWVKVYRERIDRPASLVELMLMESIPRGIRRRLYMSEKKKQRGRLRECPTIWADGEMVSVSSVRRTRT
ncbi:hypothetical protein BJY01DRAFT_236275 [Aspergillus pseudoustus]|uniref:Fungal-type protein kinase domain-containing protein n=1 Tax=Aspergillus pseudoustus TaxID=1810923 RepID=A0ABR4JP13_9EURO